MAPITEAELKQHLKALNADPTNLDLINQVAIGYFENYDLKTDKEDYDYFEKAYQLKKTVKTTHNFAWFLYFEWAEIEWRWHTTTAVRQAFSIQEACLALKPKSYLPYYQMGYMLLDKGKHRAALPHLERACHMAPHRHMAHNLGYCYFQLGQYDKAHHYFTVAATRYDTEKRSHFNLAISACQRNDRSQAGAIARKLADGMQPQTHADISGYEIALLFCLLQDYKKATDCLLKEGISHIDLADWPHLAYALSVTEPALFEQHHGQKMSKPAPALAEHLVTEPCPCLLFGCPRHNNPKDDTPDANLY